MLGAAGAQRVSRRDCNVNIANYRVGSMNLLVCPPVKFHGPHNGAAPLPILSHSLRDDVRRSLGNTGYRCLDRVHSHSENGVTVLTGSVKSFYLKQQAQEAAKRTPGVVRVINRVVVRSECPINA